MFLEKKKILSKISVPYFSKRMHSVPLLQLTENLTLTLYLLINLLMTHG